MGCAHIGIGNQSDRNIQVESFDYAWSRIGETYYDPEMNGLDWEAVRLELRPMAMEAESNDELRTVLNEMMDRLGESHFAILPAESYVPTEPEIPAEDDPKTTPPLESESEGSESAPIEAEKADDFNGSLGLKLSLNENQAFFREVDSSSDAHAKGIRVGWRLLAVDDVNVEEKLEQLSQNIEDERTRAFYGARLLINLISVTSEKPVALHVEDLEGQSALLQIQPHAINGTAHKVGMLPAFLTVYESKMLKDDQVGYVRFTEWAPPVVERFTESVGQFKAAGATKGIIVDLRENPGGVAALSIGVAGHLISKKGTSLGIMQDKTTTLNLRVFPRPRSQRYEGPVVVLIDGLSASTSEIFAAGLQDLGEATVIGSQSAGMALASMIETLPNGDRLQFVLWNLTRTNGNRVEGAGVTPDQVVYTTPSALRTGKDPVLQAALNFLLKTEENSE